MDVPFLTRTARRLVRRQEVSLQSGSPPTRLPTRRSSCLWFCLTTTALDGDFQDRRRTLSTLSAIASGLFSLADTEEVTGSNPVSPTSITPGQTRIRSPDGACGASRAKTSPPTSSHSASPWATGTPSPRSSPAARSPTPSPIPTSTQHLWSQPGLGRSGADQCSTSSRTSNSCSAALRPALYSAPRILALGEELELPLIVRAADSSPAWNYLNQRASSFPTLSSPCASARSFSATPGRSGMC